ncbi:arylsulfatase [Alienimonas californiensis]|uniref:Arylsulfatase n=1 Tax=Alienimonas californiensis TaxID=2527989 RepID=A0A517P9E0_9PLAN|nr:arylsulfatase [Alienimonas californiensis]QDT15997.1 Arylsulfatase [Alienimonas californiensis]
MAVLLTLGAASLCLGSALAADPADAGSAAKPNVVWFMADDLGYGDVGAFGATAVPTPNIDALAARGMKFTDFYAGSTVCAPSRSVLMTGLHTGHTPIRGNARVPLADGYVTVAETLQDAGYRTGLFGKWGLGEPGSEGVPTKQGFDEFFGYLNQHHAHNYYPAFLYRNEEVVPQPNVVPAGAAGREPRFGVGYAAKKGAYSAEVIHEEALQFVENSAKGPFFLYYASTLPHANNEARRRPGGGSEVPGLQYDTETADRYLPDYGAFADRDDWDDATKGQAAMIALLDKQVGELVAKIDELGLTESTLILFTSDNGPHNESGHDLDQFDANGPLTGLKRTLTEGGIRVPTIACWPGHVPAGTTSDHVAYFGDFYATAADLAGVEPPPGLDSISFAPTLRGYPDQQERHDHLYWEFYEQGSKQAVRKGDWKAIFRPLGSQTPALYDLSTDLAEQHDVAAEHPEIVAQMVAIAAAEHVPDPQWKPSGKVSNPTGPKRGKGSTR